MGRSPMNFQKFQDLIMTIFAWLGASAPILSSINIDLIMTTGEGFPYYNLIMEILRDPVRIDRKFISPDQYN